MSNYCIVRVLAWLTSLCAFAPLAFAEVGQTQPIAWNELGAKATAQYSGSGLAVSATANGARLRCAFQRLEGDVTPEGLRLSSTTAGAFKTVFGLTAISMGREHGQCYTLPSTGTVETASGIARFIRSGLIEEYSVSVDGLRQDFVLPERVAGEGTLRVELKVSGASVEPASDGARLVLKGGRTLNYHRLRATDATGRELAAWMEVAGESKIQNPNSEAELAVMVEVEGATYPVRIDPTFSDANWTSLGGFPGVGEGRRSGFPGLATSVGAVAVDSLGNVYVGGAFAVAGDVFATNIAKWNGNSWSALGSGITASPDYPFYGGSVNALAVSGTNLYVGGVFTSAGGVAATNIAKWNGSSWSALGSGINSNVLALAVSGNELYVGGWFTSAGGAAATNIAKWNGSSWSPLGAGIVGAGDWSGVNALAISGTDLFAGGRFIKAGSVAVNNIAKWNGSSWSALGAGIRNPALDHYQVGVHALTISGTDLYAGGFFTVAGGVAATNVARWNGSSWSSLGSGVNDIVLALTVSSGQLCVGGAFASAGGVPANGIAKWNGSNWSAFGSGLRGSGEWVAALAVFGTNLYAGGPFSGMDGIGAGCIARWNGIAWSALASGAEIGGSVNALAVSGSELFAGGQFLTPGGVAGIAKWNGSGWSALSPGANGTVSALVVSGSDLYVGGHFARMGGTPAVSVAKWNGSNWSALGDGIHGDFDPFGSLGYVYALAVSGTNLYAAGDFLTAGAVAANNIAMWNGSSWQALGSGMNGPVYALAVIGTNLYAGGWYNTAGGAVVNSIARWNGSSWSALGSGIRGTGEDLLAPGYVSALAVSGSNLYAGGLFMTAGSVAANNIAIWNGSSWNALGLGTGGYYPGVSALALSGDDLYVAGSFTMAGGADVSHIAKWNGNGWSALGSGIGGSSPSASALAVLGSHLYAGGTFSVAGGKVAGGIAKARIKSTAESIARSSGSALIRFSGVTGYEYDVQRTTSLNPPILWTPVSASAISPADDGSFTFNDTNAPSGMAYYRAVQR